MVNSLQREIMVLANGGEGGAVDSAGLAQWAADAKSGKLDTVPLCSPLLGALTKACRKGAVVCVNGAKASSKSLWMTQNLALWHVLGVPCAFRFLEDGPEIYQARILAQISGISTVTDPDWVKSNPAQFDELYATYKQFLDEVSPSIEADDTGSLGYRDLIQWVRKRVAQGCRIVSIDPITAAAKGRDVWTEDQNFMMELKSAVKDKATAILVTHPNRDGTKMSGGEAFSRFAHVIIELKRNNELKKFFVRDKFGMVTQIVPDRLWFVDKARFAPGTGQWVASTFDSTKLTFSDVGLVVPKPKNFHEEGDSDTF